VCWSGARFDADRAVAVHQDGKQQASGYVVASGLVLTCEHFLKNGPLAVRHRLSSAQVPAELIGRSEAADVALLRCDGWANIAPVTIGAIESGARECMPFDMYGWPLWSTEVVDDELLEAGRTVRGVFEPWDTSPDGNLVLQPSRWGGDIPAGWGGMSGAAVFSLDRLVGVQRRLLNPQDATSIEARPLAPLMQDEAFEPVLTEAGVALERRWAPRSTDHASRSRLELHGPTRVPLLSPVRFHVRVDGWTSVHHVFAGVRSGLPARDAVEITPLVEVPFIAIDPRDVGRSGTLIVDATGEKLDDERTEHAFTIDEPDDADLAFAFETAIELLETVRGGGSPSAGLRAAELCAVALDRLRAAAEIARSSRVAAIIVSGVSGASESLAVERSRWRNRLADQDAEPSTEAREMSKYAFHRAYVAREELRRRGAAAPAARRSAQERSAATALLGFHDPKALKEHLHPSLETLLADPRPFTQGFIRMMLAGDVNLRHADFVTAAPEVQAQTYDLVNALITEGWARWVEGFDLTLTQLGRAGLAARPSVAP
jgi:hypothetical protein